MNELTERIEFQRLTTPRAAAVAGILFALLFAASLILIRIAIPADLSGGTAWVEQGTSTIKIALGLMPFAGIAFLWFIGVLRDRLGELEDRFFSTVFFGSSLLFLAMVFVSSSIAGSIIATARIGISESPDQEIITFGRAIMFQISNIYAIRMAGVMMISLGTIWLRTGLMPRWLAVITFLLALALLLITNISLWVPLVFPAWVLLISVFILARNLQK